MRELLVTTMPDGVPVRLKDVATVTQGYKEREAVIRFKGHEAVELAIYKEGDANTVAVAEALRKALNRMQTTGPSGMGGPRMKPKAAGPAQKDVDDALWKRFRAAQDTFFGARDAENNKLDEEYAANAEVKRTLLVEAEKLLPITDPKGSREQFRELAEKWDAAGKVPRSEMKDLEARFKRVEQAVRGAEDDQWRRSNPEAQARAADTVAQLESSIESLHADLAKAEAAGNEKRVIQARADIEARQSWLDEAKKALSEFTP